MSRLPLIVAAVVESRSAAAGLLNDPGEAVIIERGVPRWMFLKCPCGCGDEIPINLDARAGKAWRYYNDSRHGVTLYPSVWRDTGCESHFIIWRGEIWLFGRGWDRSFESGDSSETRRIRADRVLALWPERGFAAVSEIADLLNETPWDVLDGCRQLCREGHLVEGTGTDRGTFSRTQSSG